VRASTIFNAFLKSIEKDSLQTALSEAEEVLHLPFRIILIPIHEFENASVFPPRFSFFLLL
jgi:hypothetical protein